MYITDYSTKHYSRRREGEGGRRGGRRGYKQDNIQCAIQIHVQLAAAAAAKVIRFPYMYMFKI